MKVSDYIVEFLIEKGVTDVFGYPGGMVTHLMESFSKKREKICAHINYHEQGAAFAACGYAQATGIPGVAYATSGPGATNLVTGIANAWFDSIPTLFVTGQVNTFEAKGNLAVRQHGFQETNILAMVGNITKYCAYVATAEDICYELDKAWYYANEGRKGPVLLDIPMNVQRGNVDPKQSKRYRATIKERDKLEKAIEVFRQELKMARKPVLLIGAGIKTAHAEEYIAEAVKRWNIPIVSSMLAVDVIGRDNPNYFGFIGAYGDRAANFIVAKSDLIISLGSRLDIRQTGASLKDFGRNARLLRIEIDEGELTRKIKKDEIDILCDICDFLKKEKEMEYKYINSLDEWGDICWALQKALSGRDQKRPNEVIHKFSERLSADIMITTDVGQNQVWIAQSFKTKIGQEIFFSGGHGAMGYSLPAAIGVYYGSHKPVVSFNGDGGIQMNIQELQFVAREKIPILIVILNNFSLGMIRHFQEMYFESNYYQTTEEGGYTVPDFSILARAYGLEYFYINSDKDIEKWKWNYKTPQIVEIGLDKYTYVFPKIEYGKPNQDQEPLLDRKLYWDLMELDLWENDVAK